MEDRCIVCGDIIPEGRQICLKCEGMTNHKKRIFDVNCITCRRFFECNGKAHKDQLCVMYEERKDEDGRTKNVHQESNG